MLIYEDPLFARIDVQLRRGGNINRSDPAAFAHIGLRFSEYEHFYSQYGSAIQLHPDGCYFLSVTDGLLPSRNLPRACIHLGMVIELKSRDPAVTRTLERISIPDLLHEMRATIPRDTLHRVYAPKNREMTMDRAIEEKYRASIQELARLSFIERIADLLRPLEAIHRFADVARYNNHPDRDQALRLAVRSGIFIEGTREPDGDGDDHGASQAS